MQLDPVKFKEEIALFKSMRASVIFFIEKMWGLKPQPLKEENKIRMQGILLFSTGELWQEKIKTIQADWFEPFEKGKHITWQQWLILLCVEKAIRNEAPKKITISSGHGIGKTADISWIILWFLFTNYNAQVPVTAPTADQMYDVLWKELKLWIDKMPKTIKAQYEWGKDHVRMVESAETWFARAKTSSKENSEALAGVHADHVLTIADEASGVEEQIFNTAEGAWTSGNILVILISNPTRPDGYFFDTHHKLGANWQRLQFSSIDSPVVDKEYEASIAERHGRDSVEYGIRVLGKFPNAGMMDESGYVSLLSERNITEREDVRDDEFSRNSILGVDPAGDGDDKTSWVIRDQFKAKKLHEEAKSTPKTIAERTITFIEKFKLNPYNVIVDAFGVGQDVGKEIAIATNGRFNVRTVNTGELSDTEQDAELYLNQRAEFFYKSKLWLQSGGEIVQNKNFREELLTIKYKRNIRGKIQIMPKVEMKKKYGTKSPNDADAFSLTFFREVHSLAQQEYNQQQMDGTDFDPFAVI